MPIEALLFDLDDTLYDERQYVISGFRAVAAHIAGTTGLDEDSLCRRMIEILELDGRGEIFDRLLADFGISGEATEIKKLVSCYRNHRPSLKFYPEAAAILRSLGARYRLAVVTDGLPVMQRAKVEALGLASLVDHIVYTWEIDAPKPDPAGFQQALELLDTTAENAALVADHPEHDMLPGAKLGMTLVRVRTGRQREAPDNIGAPADYTIDSIAELPAILKKITG